MVIDMEKYVPYPLYYDDMPIDISFVFESERPAGKHGFMKAAGDHFEFEDGTKARFWGVNFNGGACFPSHEYSEIVAERLAKTGCNIVRFHQLDAEWDCPNIFSYTRGKRIDTTRKLDPRSMERLDYLIYCLKEHGIYCYLDMLTYRRYKSGDGVEAVSYTHLDVYKRQDIDHDTNMPQLTAFAARQVRACLLYTSRCV